MAGTSTTALDYLVRVRVDASQVALLEPAIRQLKTSLHGAKVGLNAVGNESAFAGINLVKLTARAMATIPVWLALRAAMMTVFTTMGDGMQRIIDFDAALAKMGAVTSDFGAKTRAAMGEALNSIVEQTGRSVKEVSDAYLKIAETGQDAATAIAGTQVAMKLSVGTFAESGQTARILIDLYNVFGNTIKDATTPLEKMQSIAGVFGVLWKRNAGTLNEYIQGMSTFSTVAKEWGLTLDQSIMLVTTLHNAMQRSTVAGTQMARALQEMTKNRRAVERFLGSDTYQPIRSNYFEQLIAIIKKLKEMRVAGVDVTQSVSQMFGERSQRGVLGLVAVSDKLLSVWSEIQHLPLSERVKVLEELFQQQADTIQVQIDRFKELTKEVTGGFLANALGADEFTTALKNINDFMQRTLLPTFKEFGKVLHDIPVGATQLFKDLMSNPFVKLLLLAGLSRGALKLVDLPAASKIVAAKVSNRGYGSISGAATTAAAFALGTPWGTTVKTGVQAATATAAAAPITNKLYLALQGVTVAILSLIADMRIAYGVARTGGAIGAAGVGAAGIGAAIKSAMTVGGSGVATAILGAFAFATPGFAKALLAAAIAFEIWASARYSTSKEKRKEAIEKAAREGKTFEEAEASAPKVVIPLPVSGLGILRYEYEQGKEILEQKLLPKAVLNFENAYRQVGRELIKVTDEAGAILAKELTPEKASKAIGSIWTEIIKVTSEAMAVISASTQKVTSGFRHPESDALAKTFGAKITEVVEIIKSGSVGRTPSDAGVAAEALGSVWKEITQATSQALEIIRSSSVGRTPSDLEIITAPIGSVWNEITKVTSQAIDVIHSSVQKKLEGTQVGKAIEDVWTEITKVTSQASEVIKSGAEFRKQSDLSLAADAIKSAWTAIAKTTSDAVDSIKDATKAVATGFQRSQSEVLRKILGDELTSVVDGVLNEINKATVKATEAAAKAGKSFGDAWSEATSVTSAGPAPRKRWPWARAGSPGVKDRFFEEPILSRAQVGSLFTRETPEGKAFYAAREKARKEVFDLRKTYQTQGFQEFPAPFRRAKLATGELAPLPERVPNLGSITDVVLGKTKDQKDIEAQRAKLLEEEATDLEKQLVAVSALESLGYTQLEIEKTRLALMLEGGAKTEEYMAQQKKVVSMMIEDVNRLANVLQASFAQGFKGMIEGEDDFEDFANRLGETMRNGLTTQMSEGFASSAMKMSGLGELFGMAGVGIKEVFGGLGGKIESSHLRGIQSGAIVIYNAHVRGIKAGMSGGDVLDSGDFSSVAGMSGAPTAAMALGSLGGSIGDWMKKPVIGTYSPNAGVAARGTRGAYKVPPKGAQLTASGRTSASGMSPSMVLGGGLVGYSQYQAATAGGIGTGQAAASGIMSGVGTGMMMAAAANAWNPVGWILAGALLIGGILTGSLGGKKSSQTSTQVSENRVASKIDVTNKKLELINRNLLALNRTMETYILPQSAYFSTKTNLADEFALSGKR